MLKAASGKAALATLILIAITILLTCGALTAWRWVDEAVASDLEFSSSKVPGVTSCIGPLSIDNADVGDVVFLNNVRLKMGPNPALFVVSGGKGVQMLVTSESVKKLSQSIRHTVDIEGTLRRLPARRILRNQWKLSQEQIGAFGQERVYIDAESIKNPN